jgi:hypothetical protein
MYCHPWGDPANLRNRKVRNRKKRKMSVLNFNAIEHNKHIIILITSVALYDELFTRHEIPEQKGRLWPSFQVKRNKISENSKVLVN